MILNGSSFFNEVKFSVLRDQALNESMQVFSSSAPSFFASLFLWAVLNLHHLLSSFF